MATTQTTSTAAKSQSLDILLAELRGLARVLPGSSQASARAQG